MVPRNDVEAIRQMILEETKYLRLYEAQVVDVDDPEKLGRVKALVPFLGWTTQDVAPWVRPRGMHAIVVPVVGEWVEIAFMQGDQNRAVYRATAMELEGMLPAAFDGEASTVVLFQDPTTGDSITYDRSTGKMTLSIQGKDVAEMTQTLASILIQGMGLKVDGSASQVTTVDGTILGSPLVSNALTDPTFWTAMTALAAMVGMTVTSQKATWGVGP